MVFGYRMVIGCEAAIFIRVDGESRIESASGPRSSSGPRRPHYQLVVSNSPYGIKFYGAKLAIGTLNLCFVLFTINSTSAIFD